MFSPEDVRRISPERAIFREPLELVCESKGRRLPRDSKNPRWTPGVHRFSFTIVRPDLKSLEPQKADGGDEFATQSFKDRCKKESCLTFSMLRMRCTILQLEAADNKPKRSRNAAASSRSSTLPHYIKAPWATDASIMLKADDVLSKCVSSKAYNLGKPSSYSFMMAVDLNTRSYGKENNYMKTGHTLSNVYSLLFTLEPVENTETHVLWKMFLRTVDLDSDLCPLFPFCLGSYCTNQFQLY